MIDIRYIREASERVKSNLRRKGMEAGVVDEIRALDEEHRALLMVLDTKRAKRNAGSKGKPSPEELAELKKLSEEIKHAEQEERVLSDKIYACMRRVPNMLANDVPDGQDEASNEVLREVGQRPTFSFEVKDHLWLGEQLGIIDVERAAKVSGSRFAYLKGDGALLQIALLQYAMTHLQRSGFTPVIPPHLISVQAMDAMGYLAHGGEEEIYHLKNDEMVLIGTSEQAIGPMHMNEILDEEVLPLRYAGYSSCYRREAGSYGKDVRGILRLHQFDKIEMFTFVTPETSDEEHLRLLAIQEELMQGLGLPYRVVRLCAGDTGTPSSRTYDIETWMPAQGQYRETHSTSNTTDYQTRRLGIRIKRAGKNVYAHALNGTAFAIGRTLIALLENNQREDGAVDIPEVLQPYLGGRTVIGSGLSTKTER